MTPHQIYKEGEKEFEEKFEVLEKGNSNGTFVLEVGDRIETSNERAKSHSKLQTIKLLESVVEMMGEEIVVIEEGIQACKDDCVDATSKDIGVKELNYIWGKSQALKIMKKRFSSLQETLTNEINLIKEA